MKNNKDHHINRRLIYFRNELNVYRVYLGWDILFFIIHKTGHFQFDSFEGDDVNSLQQNIGRLSAFLYR